VAGERACIVCEGRGPFVLTFSRDGFTLVRCPACGLVFQEPQPTDDDLARTYYHDEEWTRMLLGPLREILLERAQQQLSFLDQAGVRPDERGLLDVGCSSGSFMELAGRRGWTAIGVELGESTAQAARDRGLDVRTGTLRAVADQFPPGSFSLITFWDVLEHLRDPREELALARRLLAPGGTLAATMPNVAGLYPQTTLRLLARPTGAWEYPELPVHLYDFSTRTAMLLFRGNGFGNVRSRTFATPFWYYRGTTLSVGALGGRIRGRMLRAAFEALHPLLYPLARATDRGNSQFVVATPLPPA
jgi:SAM-dependent methyltransferase